jgi:hypothetical protein
LCVVLTPAKRLATLGPVIEIKQVPFFSAMTLLPVTRQALLDDLKLSFSPNKLSLFRTALLLILSEVGYALLRIPSLPGFK